MPKGKKKKKTPAQRRRSAIRKADTAFSLFIRERDYYKCCTCPKDKGSAPIQCGHLFTRGFYSTRWEEDNAKAQCAGCNMRHERDPGPMTVVWLEEFGQEGYADISRQANRASNFKTWEIEEIAEKYTKKLEELMARRDANMAKELP